MLLRCVIEAHPEEEKSWENQARSLSGLITFLKEKKCTRHHQMFAGGLNMVFLFFFFISSWINKIQLSLFYSHFVLWMSLEDEVNNLVISDLLILLKIHCNYVLSLKHYSFFHFIFFRLLKFNNIYV